LRQEQCALLSSLHTPQHEPHIYGFLAQLALEAQSSRRQLAGRRNPRPAFSSPFLFSALLSSSQLSSGGLLIHFAAGQKVAVLLPFSLPLSGVFPSLGLFSFRKLKPEPNLWTPCDLERDHSLMRRDVAAYPKKKLIKQTPPCVRASIYHSVFTTTTPPRNRSPPLPRRSMLWHRQPLHFALPRRRGQALDYRCPVAGTEP
jgi:hypothetical protein